MIQSKDHRTETYEINEISLCRFEYTSKTRDVMD